MLPAILLGLATLAAAELAMRAPLAATFAAIPSGARRIVKVMGSKRISDIHKERVIPVYAMRLAGRSLLLFIILAAVLIPYLIVWPIGWSSFESFLGAFIQPLNLIVMVVVGVGYVWLRRRFAHGG